MVKKQSSNPIALANDEVVEENNVSANKPTLPSSRSMPQLILDQFWKLSSLEAMQRRSAALKLVEALRTESSEEILQYCLNRLLRGLASDHAAARHGFASAFACVLPMLFDALGEQKIFAALQKELPVAKKLDKSDAIDSAVGRLVAYAAIAKSDCQFTLDFYMKLLRGVVLLKSCRKAWLEMLCSEIFVLTATKFDKCSFKDNFIPLIQQELDSDWETCTANSLWLLLELHSLYPKIIKHRAVLLKSGNLIETEKTFEPLSEVIEESFRVTPTLHPLVPCLIRHVFQSETLASFWQNVVENRLLKQNFIERLSIVEAACPLLTIENVDIVFSTGFFKLLLNMSINAKGKQAKRIVLLQFCDRLKQWLSSAENGLSSDIAVKMLKNIYMVSPSFDSVSGLKLTHVLLSGIKASSSSEVSIKFLLEFLTSTELLRNERDVQTIISHSVTLAAAYHEQKAEEEGNLQLALSFFALLAFSTNKSTFKSNGLRLEIPEVWRTNEKFREMAKNAFLRLIDGMFHVSLTPGKLKFSVQPGDLRSLCHVLKAVSKDLPEIQCKNALDLLKAFTKTHEGEEDRKILAFRPLLAAVVSWTLSQPSEYLALLNELMTCFEKSNAEPNLEEPLWPDVLVDLCIGVMSKPSRFCRAPVCIAIHFLTPMLTTAQVDLILQSVDPERSALELDEESDEEFSPIASPTSNGSIESEDQMNEGTSSLSSTKSDAEVDESEQSETDEEEHNLMINPMLREKVRKALGDAAVDDVDNEEEAERSDLSDSEMMRFDLALSQIFKSQSKEAKKRDRGQIVAFRSRCIELLNVIVNSKPTSEVLLHMMPVLLRYADAALRQRENQHLYEQIISLIQGMIGMKKVPHVKGEELLKAAKSILDLMNGITNIKQQKHVGDAFGLLLRMLKHLEEESSDVSNVEQALFDMISGALSEALNNQSAIFPMPILRVAFERKAEMFLPILKSLGACITNSDQRVFLRSEACELGVILIRFNGEKSLENPGNQKILIKFSKSIFSCLNDFLSAPDTIKPRLFAEILKLVRILSKIPSIGDLIPVKIGENFKELTKSGTWSRQPWKKVTSQIVKALHKAPYYVVKEILQNASGNKQAASKQESADNDEVPKKIQKLE